MASVRPTLYPCASLTPRRRRSIIRAGGVCSAGPRAGARAAPFLPVLFGRSPEGRNPTCSQGPSHRRGGLSHFRRRPRRFSMLDPEAVEAYVEETAEKYRRYLNPSLSNLLKF